MSDSNSNLKLEALYTIFEKHLYDFDEAEDSQAAFIDKIVNDYMKFLISNRVAIPRRWEAQITDELRDQVRKMLVKKMYGCLSIEEYLGKRTDRSAVRKQTRKKFSKLF